MYHSFPHCKIPSNLWSGKTCGCSLILFTSPLWRSEVHVLQEEEKEDLLSTSPASEWVIFTQCYRALSAEIDLLLSFLSLPSLPLPSSQGVLGIGDEVPTYEDVVKLESHPQLRSPLYSLVSEQTHSVMCRGTQLLRIVMARFGTPYVHTNLVSQALALSEKLGRGLVALLCIFKSLCRYRRPGYTQCSFGHNSSSSL